MRKNGYSVRVTHYRDYNIVKLCDEDGSNEEFMVVDNVYEVDLDLLEEATGKIVADMTGIPTYQLPKNLHRFVTTHGGSTIVEITDPNGNQSVAESVCSHKDNFNRRLGVKLALKRALQQLKKNECVCTGCES